MEFNRRTFLRAGLLTSATTAVSCVAGRQNSPFAPESEEPIPTIIIEESPAPIEPISTGEQPDISREIRLLNRAGYGPRPGDLEEVMTVGYEAYLQEQLNPAGIDDVEVEQILADNDLYRASTQTLLEEEPRDLFFALGWETLARKIYSKKQLYEALVEFWSDHFHIYPRKARLLSGLKVVDDREVIRPHALGRFRDLLAASVHSPAMLVYLDNVRNIAESPNENYARELLELHTMGVNAGYSQDDVEAVARLLTGLSVRPRGSDRGEVIFVNRRHDNREKSVLGTTFAANQGEQDIEDLIDFLASHPKTADFISYKLVRRFVSDVPPPALVNSASQIFQQSDGDIQAVMSHILLSSEFANADPKLKRPLTFFASVCRALDADIRPTQILGMILTQLGQVPFMWPAPNGYPDVAHAWTGTLLARWNLALALAHREIDSISYPDIDTERLLQAVRLSNLTSDDLRALLTEYAQTSEERTVMKGDLLALWLSSPEFQWI